MKCWWIFFHNWDKWLQGTTNVWSNGTIIAKRSHQQKFCLKCGLHKIRKNY